MNQFIRVIKKIDQKVNNKFPGRSFKLPSQIDIIFEWLPVGYLLFKTIKNRKNNSDLKEAILIILLSHLIAWSILKILKNKINRRRPGSFFEYNSFPSRHTCTSFYGAQILYVSTYTNTSEKISAYVIAICTGILRIHRKKHWLSDIVAGGIIGLNAAYAGFYVYKKLFK